ACSVRSFGSSLGFSVGDEPAGFFPAVVGGVVVHGGSPWLVAFNTPNGIVDNIKIATGGNKMALTDAMQATVRTLNVPTRLHPYSHEWVQAVFTAASDAADRALNEAEALPKGEFLARYRRDYKPRIRAYLD